MDERIDLDPSTSGVLANRLVVSSECGGRARRPLSRTSEHRDERQDHPTDHRTVKSVLHGDLGGHDVVLVDPSGKP